MKRYLRAAVLSVCSAMVCIFHPGLTLTSETLAAQGGKPRVAYTVIAGILTPILDSRRRASISEV